MNISYNYEDLIYQKRPASSHPRMDRKDRAKIFAPFAALRGYGAAITSTADDHQIDDLQAIDEDAFLKELYEMYQE